MTELNLNASEPQQKPIPSFADFCVYKQAKDETKDKSFVGIKIENGCPKIYFPMGYRLKKPNEDVCKRDFHLLFTVLSDVSLQRFFSDEEQKTSRLEFPFYAYLTVLRYYLDFGYFVESEVVYKKGRYGKINWPRTIKNVKPKIVNNGKDCCQVVYLDQISRKMSCRENALITQIHKFCVKESVDRIGLLYGVSKENIETPELLFNYELFSEVILKKISETFIDKHLMLFQAMLKIVQYRANKDSHNDVENSIEEFFGVNTFAPIWEGMVDNIFNNLPYNLCKENFYPNLNHVPEFSKDTNGFSYQEETCSDVEHKRSTLRPDTIMQHDKCLFVLDSKFYKYGFIEQRKHLPGAESICKQMAYAEYVEKKIGYPPRKIFNVFVMPYCAEEGGVADGSNIFFMKPKGYIYGDWKDRSQPYHKIACVFLDLKSVMKNYSSSLNAQKELANIIAPLSPQKFRKRKRK